MIRVESLLNVNDGLCPYLLEAQRIAPEHGRKPYAAGKPRRDVFEDVSIPAAGRVPWAGCLRVPTDRFFTWTPNLTRVLLYQLKFPTVSQIQLEGPWGSIISAV